MNALRRLPDATPVPPRYVWPLLAAVEGIDARDAIAEANRTDLRVSPGPDALWHLARAVDAGRRGDRAQADEFAMQADAIFERVPRFAGYRHLGHRLAAEAAIEDGWGDTEPWLSTAEQWFSERGLDRPAASCRALLRKAGVPRRRIRGDTPVPVTLAAMGITGREIDVLVHLAEGLTNKAIAERLFISPRTVKSHIEHLLTKTGMESRVQLASLAIGHGLGSAK
jgi:DNA-binding CsgD family transcriptional regulator